MDEHFNKTVVCELDKHFNETAAEMKPVVDKHFNEACVFGQTF